MAITVRIGVLAGAHSFKPQIRIEIGLERPCPYSPDLAALFHLFSVEIDIDEARRSERGAAPSIRTFGRENDVAACVGVRALMLAHPRVHRVRAIAGVDRKGVDFAQPAPC